MCFDSSISLYSLNNSWQTAQKVFLLSKFSVSYLVFEVGNRIGWCYVYWLRSVTLPAIMFPFETAKFFFASLNQDYSILCWVSTLGGGGGGGVSCTLGWFGTLSPSLLPWSIVICALFISWVGSWKQFCEIWSWSNMLFHSSVGRALIGIISFSSFEFHLSEQHISQTE